MNRQPTIETGTLECYTGEEGPIRTAIQLIEWLTDRAGGRVELRTLGDVPARYIALDARDLDYLCLLAKGNDRAHWDDCGGETKPVVVEVRACSGGRAG